MLGMVRLREVWHLKYIYTVYWQFRDSPSTDRVIRSVCSSTTEYIWLPTCLSVCLWVCQFVYQKGILPLASDLYKLRHCIGLKHNVFRDVPSKNNPNWWTQRKYVMVNLDHPGSSGGELVCPVFQGGRAWEKTVCMSVCLPQAYYPLFLKLDFLSLITILYICLA